MGQLLEELQTITERVLVLAPNSENLRKLFLEWSDEITLRSAHSSDAAEIRGATLFESRDFQETATTAQVQSLLSFHLGKRSNMPVRLFLMGMPIQDHHMSPESWNRAMSLCDHVVFWSSNRTDGFEELYKLSDHIQSRPEFKRKSILLGGMNQEKLSPVEEIKWAAYTRWIKKHFEKVHWMGSQPRNFWDNGLEWLLSFS